MSRITITLHIDIPDGATVATPDVDYRDSAPQFEPPLPDAPPPDLFAEAGRIFPEATVSAAATPVCAVHRDTMKRWPAGVSKKTGKAFNASWRCNVQDCTVKPIWDAA